MFVELQQVVASCKKVTLTLLMKDGEMTVAVVPQSESREVALKQPLVLTGTPAELDTEFADAIAQYQGARLSLTEQVEATAAILAQAEKSQAGKASKALSKGKTPHIPSAPSAASGDESDNESGEDDSGSVTSPNSKTSDGASAPAAAEDGKTDQFAILGGA